MPLALHGHDVRQGVQPGTLVYEILAALDAEKQSA